MTLTPRELLTAFHGIVFGGGFLLAFTGSAVSLWSLRRDWTTAAGSVATARFLVISLWTMTLTVWLAVSIGTLVIYPWYRAAPPAGSSHSALAAYPKFLLMSRPETSGWHEFGMEWKEHVGWLAPILVTAVAVVATRYRRTLVSEPRLRRAMLVLLCASFFCATVAGLFGAMLNKMAPVR